ncbi:hypothetical protein [Bradyrhizobium sp. AUGA SZCCT0160]|uniref:hypothetical protein n=1 Tax=Bradyrhizobium sp. AUGA SZCCT0160 TaxID=2807662 RepID=UPI001BA8F775|nr:hypothetical protein [Bradyrhizobium sp. AUGA SZCCT0160]MBR1193244.1 hypothetical protein [Bradyrhizobium sp. AUGA SZCCT0160]
MTLAVYNRTVQDTSGNAVPGAHIEVRREVPGQPLAAIFSDRDGTVPLSNPFDAGVDGSFSLYAVGGAYRVRAYLGPSGTPTFEKILRYEAIGKNSESDSLAQRTQRVVTASGTDVISTSDADHIIVDKTVAGASREVMPLSSLVSSTSKKIVDGKFDAATNNITIVPKRPATFTVTIASPAVFTFSQHGLSVNQTVSLETTGALPTGLSADTLYYVKTTPTADTFTISATPGGSAINTTGSQSGVHTYGYETIMGGASYVIDSNGASIELSPRSGIGWY